MRKINERQPPWLQVLAQLLWAARQWAMKVLTESIYRHGQCYSKEKYVHAFSSTSVTLHSRKALGLSCI